MPTLHFLVPGNIEARTGGYEYDRRVIDRLRGRGWTVALHPLDGSFPQPTPAALAHAAETLAALPAGALVLIDGLALGAMPGPVAGHAHRLDLVALVHHPLALETGLTPERAAVLRDSERRALALVRHVIVTSSRTAATLAGYDVPPDRISVAEPGTERPQRAAGQVATRDPAGDDVVGLVCVATLTPRKGHEVLLRALAPLAGQRWHLTCVGSMQADAETARQLRELTRTLGLDAQVTWAGEADAEQIARYYQESDAFVLATWYEGYGMAVAEALAAGLPVLSTATGAIADLVGQEAGILIPPGDVDGWTVALRQALDPGRRARLAAGAARRQRELPTWDDTAACVDRVLQHHG